METTGRAHTNRQCPKCGHVRGAATVKPDWQCPACGIAYHKYQSYLRRLQKNVAPRQPGADAPGFATDGSTWSLFIVNIGALIAAVLFDWQLADLMAVYWAQSIIIGCSYFARIMSLEKFSTKNFRINNRAVEATRQTKQQTAIFFLFHYGFFHLAYLVFITTRVGFSPDVGFVLCGVAFAINHAYSFRYHQATDRAGTPNIGTMMFTPYLRILPMHLTIVLGAVAVEAAGVVLFCLLKTGADVAMHFVEHRILARSTEQDSRSQPSEGVSSHG